MLTKDTAICIRAVDYSETSQIVTFFTRETGKINAIAKGSKGPKSAFDGPIELFASGKIVFVQKSERLAILTEFKQQSYFSHLGYIPKAGMTFDYENLKFTIISAEPRRIKRIKIECVKRQA